MMKAIILLLLVLGAALTLNSCGQSKDNFAINPPPIEAAPSTPPSGETPRPKEPLPLKQFTLTAALNYEPIFEEHAEFLMPQRGTLLIPSEWEVTLGNAGNHEGSSVSFGSYTCFFKGASSKTHPTKEKQIEKGLRYTFDSKRGCIDETNIKMDLRPGDSIELNKSESIYFKLISGDQESGRTEAELIIDIIEWL